MNQNDEPIITPAHLAEMLTLYKKQMAVEGETATAPALNYGYMVALVQYAIAKHERADALQDELDSMTRNEVMATCHNGGGQYD